MTISSPDTNRFPKIFYWCILWTFSMLQFIFKNSAIILRKLPDQYKFLIRALSLLLNGTLHHRYIFSALNCCLWQYHLLLFTNIRNVYNIKHNLIFVWKLVNIVFKDDFLHMYYSDFSDFWKLVSCGSVATHLKCGGTFYNYFIANCPQYMSIKEFENLLIFSEDMENDKVGRFLGHSVVHIPIQITISHKYCQFSQLGWNAHISFSHPQQTSLGLFRVQCC